jgi:hypothetical protein
MNKAIANRRLYPALAGGVLVALVCGAVLKLVHTSQASSGAASNLSVPTLKAELSPLTPFDSGPFLPASPSLRLANPALLQSTSANVRLETVAAGRPDPFAPILRPRLGLARPSAAATPVVKAPAQVAPAQALPVVSVSATQALPPLPVLPAPALAGTGNQPQPTVDVALAPTNLPVLQSLMDQIVVTGVAQIGDTVSVIVKEPGSTSGRHVRAGDMIAGGQVRVTSVDTSTPEPTVMLTYNGEDYLRTVGSSSFIGAL